MPYLRRPTPPTREGAMFPRPDCVWESRRQCTCRMRPSADYWLPFRNRFRRHYAEAVVPSTEKPDQGMFPSSSPQQTATSQSLSYNRTTPPSQQRGQGQVLGWLDPEKSSDFSPFLNISSPHTVPATSSPPPGQDLGTASPAPSSHFSSSPTHGTFETISAPSHSLAETMVQEHFFINPQSQQELLQFDTSCQGFVVKQSSAYSSCTGPEGNVAALVAAAGGMSPQSMIFQQGMELASTSGQWTTPVYNTPDYGPVQLEAGSSAVFQNQNLSLKPAFSLGKD
ncbi:uncharacterized protein LOC143257284 [Tachypleus tridentatus]|uniref:uncharacterized protein LOC143257284 n=1 Tax=Tachypleus tridentatus TaxID=6853 RepID=UPI003FD2EE8D